MNFVDRLLAPFFPKAVASRLAARSQIEALSRRRAFYEGVEQTRTRLVKRGDGSVDRVVARAGTRLRSVARYLEENFDVAKGALDVMVANTVGPGIMPEPQARLRNGDPATEFNQRLLDLFQDWMRAPEVTAEHDYFACQRLAARSLFRDGEMFAQHIGGIRANLDHGTRVPYSIELLEADMCPFDSAYIAPADGFYQGVRKNTWGRPLEYLFYLEHPGGEFPITTGVATQETKRVAASDILHPKIVHRIRQTRGVSVFASVLTRFEDIKETDESERIAARMAAAMGAYIKRNAPDGFDSDSLNTAGEREFEFSAGMVWDQLLPGEEVGMLNSNRPNNALIDFRDAQLRSAAAGVGVGFSSLAKNYNGNYSSQRQELVEQYQLYAAPWQLFTSRFCQPIWMRFVQTAMATDADLVRMRSELDQTSTYDADHSRPAVPWIDPLKEINADIEAIKWRLSARSDIQRRRGINPQQTRDRIKRERDQDLADGFAPLSEEGME